MEILKIGIYLPDKAFAKAFARGLAKYAHSMEFTVMKNCKDSYIYDMVLGTGSGSYCTLNNFVRIESARKSDNKVNAKSVYKYDDCQTIINDLQLIYFQMTGDYSYVRGNRQCTAVVGIADSGGAGTTSVILSVIRTLYQVYGLRCLYVSLTPLSGQYEYMNSVRDCNFRLMLYNLESNAVFPFESFISHHDEMDVIDGGIINCDVSDLNGNLATALVKKVSELGMYDYVFFDCGSNISRENREIIANADITFLVRKNTENRSKFSEKIMEEILQLTEHSRVIKINNFDRYCSTENVKDEFFISEDSGAFGNGTIDLNHNYGTEIAAVARSIVEV